MATATTSMVSSLLYNNGKSTLLPLHVDQQQDSSIMLNTLPSSRESKDPSALVGGSSGKSSIDMPASTQNGSKDPKESGVVEVTQVAPPLRPGLSTVVDELVAVTTEEYERYERKVKVGVSLWDAFYIESLTVDFSRPELEDGWKSYTHPEGAPYFQNDSSWDIPVCTEIYVHDNELKIRLEGYIESICAYVEKYEIKLPDDIVLVLEFRQSGRCGYYFIDHTAQCLFWLDDFDALVFLDLLRIKYTPSHINQKMKSMYWQHNSYFPKLRPIQEANIQEMVDLLIHGLGDSMTSVANTTPYSVTTLATMLKVVKEIKANNKYSSANSAYGSGSATTLYRFLYLFYHERFLNLYGERGARLEINQSLHPDRERTLFIKLISPILLYGPEIHFRQLKAISVDSLVRDHRWASLLQKLMDGWKEFTLYATVLLNANMAFLAIQSVDGSARSHGHSSMQRASYFSIIASSGAILLGLLLVWQHNSKVHSTSFIANRNYSVVGLETLAVMYSLPYSLLMWGFVSFLMAFLAMCFNNTNTIDSTTITLLAISGATLLLLLSWSGTLSFGERPFAASVVLRWLVEPEGIVEGTGLLKPLNPPVK